METEGRNIPINYCTYPGFELSKKSLSVIGEGKKHPKCCSIVCTNYIFKIVWFLNSFRS